MLNLSVVMPRFMLLHAGDPVITAAKIEAKTSQPGRSVVTREYGNRLKSAPI